MPQPTSNAETVRCPTCRASQVWSDTCRRCKTDLRLLRSVDTAYRRSRARCVAAIRDRRGGDALRHARRTRELRDDAEARRLLALASLLIGAWPTARDLARLADD